MGPANHLKPRSVFAVAAIILMLGLPIAAVTADDGGYGTTQCNGTLAPGTYHDVHISAGVACTITGATVKGDITGDRDSNLTLAGSTVGGDVVLESPEFVQIGVHSACSPTGSANSIEGDIQVRDAVGYVCIQGNNVGGNVDVERMHGAGCSCSDPGSLFIAKTPNTINGDLIISGNFLSDAVVTRNVISGDLQVTGNNITTSTFLDNRVEGAFEFGHNMGSSALSGNTITNDLSCDGNSPSPTGSGNTAARATNQCAGMTSPATTSTTVTCDSGSVRTNHRTDCTAVVSSTAAGITGAVSFSSDGAGQFGKVNCGGHGNDDSNDGNSLVCAVDYTPSAAGTQTITATYPGDTYHSPSTGTFQITVS